jgi:hypothetical protein
VLTRPAANGRRVFEVQVRVPRGGPGRDDEQILPLTTWNGDLGATSAAIQSVCALSVTPPPALLWAGVRPHEVTLPLVAWQ